MNKTVGFLLLTFPIFAQGPVPALSPGEAMRQSLELQRTSIRRQAAATAAQLGTADAWFTVPFSQPGSLSGLGSTASNWSSGANAPCEPLAPDVAGTLVKAAAARENLQEDLLRAVIEQESGFRPCAVSSKGARGLMQLMPATAQELGVKNALDPEENVNAGAKLLKQLLNKYNGDVRLALSAYNAGAGSVERAGGVPNIAETRNYLISILQKLPF